MKVFRGALVHATKDDPIVLVENRVIGIESGKVSIYLSL